eukprot:CAMPEP_0177634432 /NCGR_PEP_ID=MMETSP0447-20121125/3366_1 /TAXON_ID=0 /ORGANISM="Stygamoeba regulata, Strain BSH-02190019" /LENGTH=135 /DNA_ID=CAMNT_0019136155 /DNA_START=113 /DNA_END=517 /DNA_ORIENTATION=-
MWNLLPEVFSIFFLHAASEALKSLCHALLDEVTRRHGTCQGDDAVDGADPPRVALLHLESGLTYHAHRAFQKGLSGHLGGLGDGQGFFQGNLLPGLLHILGANSKIHGVMSVVVIVARVRLEFLGILLEQVVFKL